MMTLLVVALNLIMVSLWWDMEMKMDRTTGWLRTGLLRGFVMCNGSEEALCMATKIQDWRVYACLWEQTLGRTILSILWQSWWMLWELVRMINNRRVKVNFFINHFSVGGQHGERRASSKLLETRTTNVELQPQQATPWFRMSCWWWCDRKCSKFRLLKEIYCFIITVN